MSSEISTIYTDHKPLTYFLDSHLIHGIYSRWAENLNLLNVKIEYIPGEKNCVADALSRTIFPSEDYSADKTLMKIGTLVHDDNKQPCWAWKDGIGGYEDLLKTRQLNDQQDKPNDQVICAFANSMASCIRSSGQKTPPIMLEEDFFANKYGSKDITFEVYLSAVAGNNEVPPTKSKYTNDEWYKEINNF